MKNKSENKRSFFEKLFYFIGIIVTIIGFVSAIITIVPYVINLIKFNLDTVWFSDKTEIVESCSPANSDLVCKNIIIDGNFNLSQNVTWVADKVIIKKNEL